MEKGTKTEIYLIVYNNGEPYEDYWEWHGGAYWNKDDALRELKQKGFIPVTPISTCSTLSECEYEKKIDDCRSYFAEVVSLTVL